MVVIIDCNPEKCLCRAIIFRIEAKSNKVDSASVRITIWVVLRSGYRPPGPLLPPVVRAVAVVEDVPETMV